ncbi:MULTISPECIES: hypothetical protein [unclassified Brenneria]|uniref:hypothetical protein n=1 Tax=unclassified Brenneria TaxID=2634434 RepID=UPI0018F0E930|nr:hypothetical protein [Brenneria sp. L3-3C-1]MBJ7224075.1 hypothetical protein [Brenneria sp. L3-3C-1]MEE3645321.1 hypothetical protein [Brenneria sp. L3_3C_1]
MLAVVFVQQRYVISLTSFSAQEKYPHWFKRGNQGKRSLIRLADNTGNSGSTECL